MNSSILKVASVSLVMVVAGCASAVNERSANIYAQAGYGALRAGDWQAARRNFGRAVVNADLGDLDPNGRGQVNYEYGRTLGVTCSFAEAEKYLLRSKQFAEQAGRSPYLSLYELGLLAEKQANYRSAVTYFAELIPLLEREGLRATFPQGVADAYTRYANALQATGRSSDAAVALATADSIRSANPTAKPFGSVTPYGTVCEGAA